MSIISRLRRVTPDRLARFLEAVCTWIRMGARFVPDEVAQARAETCAGCKYMIRDDDDLQTCGVCGCYVTLETGWERAFSKVHFPEKATGGCPKGLW